jgi:DeoR/GlpR family transcriptional regulator of sugar metabolism
MLKRERQVYILHQVNLHNKVLSADLSQHINVSDDTPYFHRGHHSSKDVHSYQQKKIIARKAASLIKDGMFVLTSGGSTIIEVARALPPSLNATFISGSVPAIFESTPKNPCRFARVQKSIPSSQNFHRMIPC